MKKIMLAISLVLTLGSCTVYRTISFNNDHSGRMENKVDMTSLVSMMGENGGGAGSMGDMAQLDKSKSDLEAIAGITNVEVAYDTTGILTTSYNFGNVNALNTALASGLSSTNLMLGMEQTEGKKEPVIVFKGKKFTMTEIDKKTLASLLSEDKKKEMEDMDMMLASSKINTTIHFPVKVKKVSYKNASITNDQTVSFEMPVKEFISKDYKPLTVNLK
jgi:hypothetical protein